MKFLDQIKNSGAVSSAPRIVVHGAGGVGKTTLASSMPDPLLIPVEDGSGILDFESTPEPKSYSDLVGILNEIESLDEIKWKTIVIDSIDKVEPLIWQHTCDDNGGKKNIESFGYGKGYTFADDFWISIFRSLDRLRRRGVASFVVAHSASVVVDDPMVGSFNRMQPKLHKRASALLTEWADIVGYIDIERVPVDRGNDKRTTRTSSTTGLRRLHLEDGGGFAAKNRYALPSMIKIDIDEGASKLLAPLKRKNHKKENKVEN